MTETKGDGAAAGRLICAVDIGTTYIRCHLYDVQGAVVSSASEKIQLLYPAAGQVEMNQEVLWKQFVAVIKNALKDVDGGASRVAALGISTQRNTFICWDKQTGEPFHRFCSWRDLRAAELCRSWNRSFTMKGMHAGSKLVYFITRNQRYQAGSVFKIKPIMVIMRLMYMIDNLPKLRQRVAEKQVMFGCIETWLLWKLTGGKTHATETSLASTTGMWDPYVKDWGYNILGMIGVPFHILPQVKETCTVFGETLPEIFGVSIPIAALAGDQQASMFGCCCFNRGDLKVTMGTGSFVDLNTGARPHTSMEGLLPVAGWAIRDEVTFMATAFSNDTASVLNWAHSLGLFERPEDTCTIAESVQDSAGVFFIPAFCGLQVPVNDDYACTLFLGLKPETSKAHMVRAILEALAFRVYLVYQAILTEIDYPITAFRCCGGVTKNDFVCQMIADLAERPLERMQHDETSSVGVAFLAGLTVGFWTDREELSRIVQVGKVFKPDASRTKKLKTSFAEWQRAMQRSLRWYSQEQWAVS